MSRKNESIEYTVYLIERWWPAKDNPQASENGYWGGISFDHYGTPWVTGTAGCALSSRNDNKYDISAGDICWHPSVVEGFSACGECWQKLGINGTFYHETGLEALRWFAEHFRGMKFRLISKHVVQTVTEFATLQLTARMGEQLRKDICKFPGRQYAISDLEAQFISSHEGSAFARQLGITAKSDGVMGIKSFELKPEGKTVRIV